jgi:pimeloyl-[acyl-carrier protein] methyl ester esterase
VSGTVALAGWGHRVGAWDELAATGLDLDARALPGHEPGDGIAPGDCSLAAGAERVAGDWDLLLGWSLGGLAVLEALRSGRARTRALVLIATPPAFLASPAHPAGMDPAVFAEFRDGLAGDPLATLRRFHALQFHGDRAPRSVWAPARVRDRRLALEADPAVLAAWLAVLAGADLTPAPPELTVPTLVLHGAADRVVDPAAADFFAGCGDRVTTRILPGAGHAPHIAHPEETGSHIADFRHHLPR